jgi:hypothetical protein
MAASCGAIGGNYSPLILQAGTRIPAKFAEPTGPNCHASLFRRLTAEHGPVGVERGERQERRPVRGSGRARGAERAALKPVEKVVTRPVAWGLWGLKSCVHARGSRKPNPFAAVRRGRLPGKRLHARNRASRVRKPDRVHRPRSAHCPLRPRSKENAPLCFGPTPEAVRPASRQRPESPGRAVVRLPS